MVAVVSFVVAYYGSAFSAFHTYERLKKLKDISSPDYQLRCQQTLNRIADWRVALEPRRHEQRIHSLMVRLDKIKKDIKQYMDPSYQARISCILLDSRSAADFERHILDHFENLQHFARQDLAARPDLEMLQIIAYADLVLVPMLTDVAVDDARGPNRIDGAYPPDLHRRAGQQDLALVPVVRTSSRPWWLRFLFMLFQMSSALAVIAVSVAVEAEVPGHALRGGSWAVDLFIENTDLVVNALELHDPRDSADPNLLVMADILKLFVEESARGHDAKEAQVQAERELAEQWRASEAKMEARFKDEEITRKAVEKNNAKLSKNLKHQQQELIILSEEGAELKTQLNESVKLTEYWEALHNKVMKAYNATIASLNESLASHREDIEKHAGEINGTHMRERTLLGQITNQTTDIFNLNVTITNELQPEITRLKRKMRIMVTWCIVVACSCVALGFKLFTSKAKDKTKEEPPVSGTISSAAL